MICMIRTEQFADAFKTADGNLESSLRLICEKIHAYGDVAIGKK